MPRHQCDHERVAALFTRISAAYSHPDERDRAAAATAAIDEVTAFLEDASQPIHVRRGRAGLLVAHAARRAVLTVRAREQHPVGPVVMNTTGGAPSLVTAGRIIAMAAVDPSPVLDARMTLWSCAAGLDTVLAVVAELVRVDAGRYRSEQG